MAWPLLAMAAASVASKFIGDRKKAKAAKSDREQQNANEAARAKAIQDMLANLKARGVDIYGPQTSTSQGTRTSTTSERERKVIDPLMRAGAEETVAQLRSELNRDIFGPKQIAELARQANLNADTQLNNMAASRMLSPQQLAAMKMMSQSQRIAPVLTAQSQQDEKNALYRQGVGDKILNWTNATMGSNRNSSTTETSSGSETRGPDIQTLMALATGGVPQNVSTETGYSPWASGLSAGAEAIGSMYGAGAFGGGGGGAIGGATSALSNLFGPKQLSASDYIKDVGNSIARYNAQPIYSPYATTLAGR